MNANQIKDYMNATKEQETNVRAEMYFSFGDKSYSFKLDYDKPVDRIDKTEVLEDLCSMIYVELVRDKMNELTSKNDLCGLKRLLDKHVYD